jgi:hypothetical protein
MLASSGNIAHCPRFDWDDIQRVTVPVEQNLEVAVEVTVFVGKPTNRLIVNTAVVADVRCQ